MNKETPSARLHADLALERIEEAQRELARAAEALCGVRGLAPEHSELTRLYFKVQDFWHKVSARAAARARNVDHAGPCREVPGCVGDAQDEARAP